jgi:2-oxoisovalerate dehydrogenase E1 component
MPGIVGMISHLGAMLPVADGLALAAQLRGEKRVAAVFSGDGGTSEGDFHEALNIAGDVRTLELDAKELDGHSVALRDEG